MSQHYIKCHQFLCLIKAEKHNATKILDGKYYYDIFSIPPTCDIKLIMAIIYKYLDDDLILHIMLSRKVADLTFKFLDVASQKLDTISKINKFFSFYTYDEQLNIITTNIDNYSVRYNNRSIANVMIINCIDNDNIMLYNYLLDYPVSFVIYSTAMEIIYFTDIMYNMNMSSKSFVDHEKSLKYRNSLRNTWITACLFL